MVGDGLPAGMVSPGGIADLDGRGGRRATSTSPKMPFGSIVAAVPSGTLYCLLTRMVTINVPSCRRSTSPTNPMFTPLNMTAWPCLIPLPHGNRAYSG